MDSFDDGSRSLSLVFATELTVSISSFAPPRLEPLYYCTGLDGSRLQRFRSRIALALNPVGDDEAGDVSVLLYVTGARKGTVTNDRVPRGPAIRDRIHQLAQLPRKPLDLVGFGGGHRRTPQ